MQTNIALAPFTTLQLGGKAAHFLEATSIEEILQGLSYSKDRRLPIYILGGGSNTIFADGGFPGLVMRIATRGKETIEQDDSNAILDVQAGEVWDEFVIHCISHGLSGIECLSGIPGSVGAVPIQNVGAYGQEVADTIASVRCLDRITFEQRVFTNQECEFGYRQSRFKGYDRDRYVVLSVAFRLSRTTINEPRYDELKQALRPISKNSSTAAGESDWHVPGGDQVRPEERVDALMRLRSAVLNLRKKKSMVVDNSDPESRSAGSFFLNPVLSAEQLQEFKTRMESRGIVDYPCFAAGDSFKLSAAWFVENAGFAKGTTVGGVGVSKNHSLALVNRGGTSSELMDLSRSIQKKVLEFSGVWLDREPVLVGGESD